MELDESAFGAMTQKRYNYSLMEEVLTIPRRRSVVQVHDEIINGRKCDCCAGERREKRLWDQSGRTTMNLGAQCIVY